MKSHLLKIIVLLLIANPVWAQDSEDKGKTKNSKSSNTKAEKFYQHLGYQEAIDLYRAGKLSQEAMEHMANGYRLNHDTQNAEKWYAQIVDSASEPTVNLYYAQALHSNGKLDKAREYYLKYDAMMGRNNDKRGMLLAQAIDRIYEFEAENEIEVENAWAINSNMLDFSPAFHNGGVVFVSNRKAEMPGRKKDLWTGDDYNTLFASEPDKDGKLSKPELFSLNLADKFHEGPVSFSKSADQVFFTRNLTKKSKNKEYVLKIYTAFNNSGVWGEQSQLDLGDGDSNDAHPTLSPDGQKLYFASDRDGGEGGMDLWVSTFEGGSWTAPENLGPNINTPGNELFPFIYDDGTLYFASDGWGGLGGLDNFYVEKNESNGWSNPANLDKPFNSNKDDFGYILNTTGTEGYFTSAREDGLGKDDIYRFKMAKPQGNKKKQPKLYASICAYEEGTGDRLPDVKVNMLAQADDGSFTGFDEDFLVSLKPTQTAGEYTLTLKRADPFSDDGGDGGNFTTDANGVFDAEIKPGRKYVLVGKLDGYKESRIETTAEELSNEGFCIPMQPAQCISLNGVVTNRKFGNPIPNAKVTLIDLCNGESSEMMSDAGGNFNFPCLPCGCDFVLRGTKANFKEDNSLASTVDMACAGSESLTQDLRLMPPTIGPNGELDFVDKNKDDKINKPGPAGYDLKGNPLNPDGTPYENDVYVSENGNLPKDVETMLEEGITIELDDIYYDFDKYNIRHWDAQPDLNKVVAVMRRHPDIHIELRSHTDSRASDGYNDELSANRAKSAYSYIVNRGIEAHRINYYGFGESQPVNRCVDGVECTEEEHQANRRTEVVIKKGRID